MSRSRTNRGVRRIRRAGTLLAAMLIGMAWGPHAIGQPPPVDNNGPPPGGSYEAPPGASEERAPEPVPTPAQGQEPMDSGATQGDAAMAAAPFPEEPQTRDFVVYFQADRANLTPQADLVIQAAVADAKSAGATRITVVGYTDTSRGTAESLRIAERRAKAVADALVAQGVSPSALTVVGKGKSDLAVETADGVGEPLNRRVTITLDAQP